MKIRDVSNWKVIPVPLAGAQAKLILENDGCRYMLKFPKTNQDGTQTAYHISEYISCKAASSLGYSVQEAELVKYKKQDAVLVTLFTKPLISFTGFGDSTLSHEKMIYDLDALAESVEGSKFNCNINDYMWDTFMLDSFICNLDRHPNNWGFFKNENGLYEAAPLIDLGASLYSLYADKAERIKDIDKHIEKYSNSSIKYKGGKHSFREILTNKDFEITKALTRFIKRLPNLDISSVDEVKLFYPQMASYCDLLYQFFEMQKGWYYARSRN